MVPSSEIYHYLWFSSSGVGKRVSIAYLQQTAMGKDGGCGAIVLDTGS